MPVRKILVVDDSATNRHAISEMLARHGYRCILAETGKEAIEKAKTEKPDLILMDVVMPDMDGFQATRAITRDEQTKHMTWTAFRRRAPSRATSRPSTFR